MPRQPFVHCEATTVLSAERPRGQTTNGHDIAWALTRCRDHCPPCTPPDRLGRMAEESQERSGFEILLAELSTRFTGLPGDRVDAEVEQGLRELVEFLGTDRATLHEFDADGSNLRPTHSWPRPSSLRFAIQD